MPDIDFQHIELNLIPKKGDEPVVFYASQFETARTFIADLFWGESEFAPGDSCWAEIDIRKVDDNLVVITDDVSIDNNVVSVVLPVQAVTCVGDNFGQVKIYADVDNIVAALNFILRVQPDPLANGVQSETVIDNLTTQIEEIAEAEGFLKSDDVAPVALSGSYNDLTDKPTIPDMTNYYTKSETYSKGEINSTVEDLQLSIYNLTVNKADATSVYTKAKTNTLLSDKADLAYLHSSYYSKTQVNALLNNMLPVVSDSGAITTINVGLVRLLKSITVDPLASQVVRCGKNLLPPYTFSDGGGITITSNDGTYDISGTTTSYFQLVSSLSFTLPAGTYTLNSNGSNNDDLNVQLRSTDELTTYASSSTNSVTFTINAATEVKFRITFNNPGSYSATISPQLESGSTATAFELYNSTTYPVVHIDTITTMNGINNIYADVGDVSVEAYDTIQHYIDERT